MYLLDVSLCNDMPFWQVAFVITKILQDILNIWVGKVQQFTTLIITLYGVPNFPIGIQRTTRDNLHCRSFSDQLNKIKAKTLLIWGKDDQIIPVNFIYPFIKMKNCRLILLENCGHTLYRNNSVIFNKIVIDFIKEMV